MIRHLLLIRHAKSDWGDSSLSDYDRPLNKRGARDAPMMGERLATSVARPDRILSSPAQRARSTAESIARRLGFPAHDIEWMSELYLASPVGMLDVIRGCPDDVTTLILIGHNPGISTLAAQLCGQMPGNIPTCGIVHLTGDFNTWRDTDHFSLLDFDYPKRQP